MAKHMLVLSDKRLCNGNVAAMCVSNGITLNV